MSQSTETGPSSRENGRPIFQAHGGLCILFLLAVYAAGLTHGLCDPWTGLRDWNGAFYSQLARNLLRYPMTVHHGMGVVAMGAAVPPREERSIYPTHPPGLIWLVALAFRVLGEAEWAARLAPVLASLGSVVLLIRILDRGWGRETALLAGLLYSTLPMAVYFGRMVDQEAICLCCMLGAMAAWQVLTAADSRPGWRRVAQAAWVAAVIGAIWVDWSGMLFAGLFSIHALVQWLRKRLRGGLACMVIAVALLGCAGVLVFLVYAALDGRWGDLLAIFQSRTSESEAERKALAGKPWEHTVTNLTWPMLVLAVMGVILWLISKRAHRSEANARAQQASSDLRDASWVLPATGVIWVCLFWRQYERHEYWLFYLGPLAALLAAQTLLAFRGRLMRRNARWAAGATYAVVVIVLAAAFRGTDSYFSTISYPPEVVTALKQISHGIRPDDRVLLYVSPVSEERWGGYRLRNLVPPQVAYYLDRAFDVEQDFGAVARKASQYAVYIVPLKAATEQAARVAELRTRFASLTLGPYVVFYLRSGPQ
ncbi:MAG TPA: glycosyltransferase family 39 protein [Phycisphaerae bacterium]|nr:glycosyltransferase family 39 protein [Phycisphaerae bacterium]